MSHNFIRVPPDSTGKRILTAERRVVTYDQLQSGQSFSVGDVVTGVSSTATGTVTGIHTLGFPANKGRIFLKDNSTITFQDNEQLQVSAVTIAYVNVNDTNGDNIDDLYIQNNTITDSNEPDHSLKIDADGNASVNFDGKVPFVEAQGELVVAERKMAYAPLFDYDFDDPNLINNEFRLPITSKTWPTLPLLNSGTRVKGDTSGTKGIMCAFVTRGVVDMVFITDSEGNWSPGETIRAVEDPQGHFFTLAGAVIPAVDINTTTKSVDLTMPDNAPDYMHVIRTSNMYIPQARQETTTVSFSISTGNKSCTGVTRRGGIFDDNNGVFFELVNSDGTDSNFDETGGLNTAGNPKFYVVHRTKTTGTVVNHRVAQEDFNINKLDGTDVYGFAPDFDLHQRFFIDWPGGGAGAIEYGIYNDLGARIVFHRTQMLNNTTFPSNPTDGHKLPVRVEILAHGGGTPNAESKLKVSETYVLRSVFTDSKQTLLHGAATALLENLDDTRGEVPLLSIQANKTLNGLTNRMFASLHDINVNMVDSRTSRTFDSADVTVANQIPLRNHGLAEGDPVFFKQGSGTLGNNLLDYGYYYVVKVDNNTISLANSYLEAVNATPVVVGIPTSGANTGHTIEEPSDATAVLRIRVNSEIADSIYVNHNSSRSGTSHTNGTGTGFRISPFITVTNGGTGGTYTVGDLLELDSGITAYREAVLEVTTVNAGQITEVRVANNSVAHLTEADGSTSANYGSYNGNFSSSGHKANGVGQTVIASGGTGATFGVSVEWGHGFWWAEFYNTWAEFNFSEFGDLFTDFKFFLSESGHKQGNLTLSAQVRTQPLHNAKMSASMNWTEVI